MNAPDARLLLVDDSAPMRLVIRDVLADLGITQVDEAADGIAGMERFRQAPYDLVITDWHMPRSTGLELLRRIRSAEYHRDTPVMMLTADQNAARQLQALDEGANSFITKPWVMPMLVTEVLRLISARPDLHAHAPAP